MYILEVHLDLIINSWKLIESKYVNIELCLDIAQLSITQLIESKYVNTELCLYITQIANDYIIVLNFFLCLSQFRLNTIHLLTFSFFCSYFNAFTDFIVV